MGNNLTFRRLVLIILATFILDPIWKSLSLFFACFILLLLHLYFQPFQKKEANQIETAFLCNLTLIDAIQIPSAVYALNGVILEDRLHITGIVLIG